MQSIDDFTLFFQAKFLRNHLATNLIINELRNPNRITKVEQILLVQLFSIESEANQNACYNKGPSSLASAHLGVQF